ncbi:MAG: transglutaminase family protein, partial [Angelakisella sp.]
PVGLDSWQLHGGAQPDYIENHALSPLAYGIGSCEDFACAMVVLLRQMGFEARYVPGITISVNGDFVDHAWAAVCLRDSWYHLDPQLEDNVTREDTLRYRYFLKTDKEMLADHRWGESLIACAQLSAEQKQEIEKNYLLPACNKQYSSPPPKKLGSAPRPNIGAVTSRLAAERTAYEAANGKLPAVVLDLTPPVFGNMGYGPPD